MKKVMIAVMALVFNTLLFSCTNDSIADTETPYETQVTEGDDEDVDDGRGDN